MGVSGNVPDGRRDCTRYKKELDDREGKSPQSQSLLVFIKENVGKTSKV